MPEGYSKSKLPSLGAFSYWHIQRILTMNVCERSGAGQSWYDMQAGSAEQGAWPSKLLYSLDDLTDEASSAERLEAGELAPAAWLLTRLIAGTSCARKYLCRIWTWTLWQEASALCA